MMGYSVHPRYRRFVKSYQFLYFAENMSKNIGKDKSKNLSGKYNQKPLDNAKQSAQMRLKLLQKKQFKK